MQNSSLRRFILVMLLVLMMQASLPPMAFAESSQKGRISFYHEDQHTASGERFNKHAKTCAHPKLPFNTTVTIHIKGKKASCRVNDRGPFVKGRVLDVSVAVAKDLGMIDAGVLHGTIVW